MKKSILKFTAPWCVSCRNLEPVLEEVRNKVTVERIDVGDHPELAQKYNVTSLPTVLLLDGERIAGVLMGASPKIVEEIRQFANT